MTGFGSGVRESNGFHVQAEIRSLNHRYLKVSSYVPEELNWSQSRVEQRVREVFRRGSLNVSLSLECGERGEECDIDAALLKRLYRKIEAVRSEVAPEERIRLSDLLSLDGVVRISASHEIDPKDAFPIVEGALEDAISSLRAMQTREGSHLAKEIRAILNAIDGEVAGIEELLPEAAKRSLERYRSRVTELLAGTGVEVGSADVLREVAVLSEKADITEELGRLRGHLAQFHESLEGGGGVGRKLDFLTQEMFREANTMASKVADYELARRVVEAKAGIDRLREQTQNIE